MKRHYRKCGIVCDNRFTYRQQYLRIDFKKSSARHAYIEGLYLLNKHANSFLELKNEYSINQCPRKFTSQCKKFTSMVMREFSFADFFTFTYSSKAVAEGF